MDKEIRFTPKKVDESWKEQAEREKASHDSARPKAAEAFPQPPGSGPNRPSPQKPKTSKPFFQLLNSLGYQAMMHLGEIPHPETNMAEVNLEACREIVDLLAALKEKTEGNWSEEESQFFLRFVPELQMKFAGKVE